ncbi:MAG: hypothetical protein ACRDRO_15690 [Pseudonocardiaceae bacterium]
MGKHSKLRRHRHQLTRPSGMVEMVDIRTGDTHLLTPDAAAAGRQATGRYRSLCGADILPAALVDPGMRCCRLCRSTTIPAPRAAR